MSDSRQDRIYRVTISDDDGVIWSYNEWMDGSTITPYTNKSNTTYWLQSYTHNSVKYTRDAMCLPPRSPIKPHTLPEPQPSLWWRAARTFSSTCYHRGRDWVYVPETKGYSSNPRDFYHANSSTYQYVRTYAVTNKITLLLWHSPPAHKYRLGIYYNQQYSIDNIIIDNPSLVPVYHQVTMSCGTVVIYWTRVMLTTIALSLIYRTRT